ncbi:MAG TPA: alpha/beta hydrolase, partial [Acidimicrobiales bacterium]|nr:alpha/beta hydrolase [Acidimicrobiales bacterium]
MGKQMEGDNVERRRRAKEARDAGELPSAAGVTTGASKQRRHLPNDTPYPERIGSLVQGKQDPDHAGHRPRPGRREEPAPAESPPIRSSVVLEGRPISYLDGGTGDEPIVLVHTFPLSANSWEYQLPELGPSYRVVAPDLMGFGQSDGPSDPEAYSVESWADDVGAVMADLEIDGAPVIGVGLGADIAFNLFRRHHGVVAGLVLADFRSEPDTPEERDKRDRDKKWLAGGGDVTSLLDDWFALVAGDVWSRRAEVIQKAREWALEAPLVGLIGALDAIDRRPDVQHDLAKIDLPTLVLTGELNDLV